MQRITPAKAPFAEPIAAWLEKTMPPGRPPLGIFTTMARDTRLFERFTGGGLLDPGHLTVRQREIAIDRTVALCRAEYEWGVHIALYARATGLDERAQYALAHGDAEDALWSEDERALIAACDMLHERATLDDPTWTRLRASFSEEAVIEILMLAGFYRTVSYITNALAIEHETFAIPFPPVHGPGVAAVMGDGDGDGDGKPKV